MIYIFIFVNFLSLTYAFIYRFYSSMVWSFSHNPFSIPCEGYAHSNGGIGYYVIKERSGMGVHCSTRIPGTEVRNHMRYNTVHYY